MPQGPCLQRICCPFLRPPCHLPGTHRATCSKRSGLKVFSVDFRHRLLTFEAFQVANFPLLNCCTPYCAPMRVLGPLMGDIILHTLMVSSYYGVQYKLARNFCNFYLNFLADLCQCFPRQGKSAIYLLGGNV